MEKTPRVGLANIKKTGKKNGSSDLVDFETFRMLRGSSDEFTSPIEGSVNIRAFKNRAFQPAKEEELPSSIFILKSNT